MNKLYLLHLVYPMPIIDVQKYPASYGVSSSFGLDGNAFGMGTGGDTMGGGKIPPNLADWKTGGGYGQGQGWGTNSRYGDGQCQGYA